MYIYSVGYYSYEESKYWQFFHEEKYSEEELASIVEDCLFKCLLDELKKRSEYEREFNDTLDEGPTIQNVFGYQDEFAIEMEAKGFSRVKFTEEISLFGWVNATDNNWSSQTDEKTIDMINRLKSRLDANSMSE